jgi:hypothetical protein
LIPNFKIQWSAEIKVCVRNSGSGHPDDKFEDVELALLLKLWPCRRNGELRQSLEEDFVGIKEFFGAEEYYHGELSGGVKSQFEKDRECIIFVMCLFRESGLPERRREIIRISPYL